MEHEIHVASGGQRYMNVASISVARDDEILYYECRCAIKTFFSSLSWEEKTEVWESHEVIYGRNPPHPLRCKQRTEVLGRIGINGFSYHGLFEPKNDLQKDALAFYRQAQNAKRKSPLYHFLSLYKIFELENRKNPEKRINACLKDVRYPGSLLSNWEKEHSESVFAKHCEKYRHGIAHARGYKRLVNPDVYRHWKELNQLRHILQDLAEHYIEKDLGVK